MLKSGSKVIGVKPYSRPSGQRILAGYAFSRQLDWAVIVERDEEEAYRAVASMRSGLLLWVSIGLGIATLGALFLAHRISKPVEALAGVAAKVGKGHLDTEVPEINSRDEIGDLADTMKEMISGLQEREFIREAFGRYVSPEVAQSVLEDPDGLKPGGSVKTVTVLMSDLRGFTSLSERFSPAQMVELLNDYLGLMADTIAQHGGTVIEFIGDAVMALFGAPASHDDDAVRAVACTIDMQRKLDDFNRDDASKGIPELQMGIGLNTGSVIVGNIGSEKRMKYGVVGDTVNMAARAESFTVGGEILVAEGTYEAVGSSAVFRGPFEVRAKGKKDPMRLYAVVEVGAPYNLVNPFEGSSAEGLVSVSLRAKSFKISGKEIAKTPMEASVFELGQNHAGMDVKGDLQVFDNVRLDIDAGGELGRIEDVYAKVTGAEKIEGGSRCQLRFTSVPKQQSKKILEILEG